MSIVNVIVIAFVLSLDAFSISISCGIKLGNKQLSKYLKISLAFGIFQALMPLGGWLLGNILQDFIGKHAPWISFTIFFVLGLKTLRDALKNNYSEAHCQCDKHLCLFNLAVATSIDAFLIGIVLSFSTKIPLYISLPTIGIITIIMSYLGCHIGNLANRILRKWSQIFAAFILIALAIKSIL